MRALAALVLGFLLGVAGGPKVVPVSLPHAQAEESLTLALAVPPTGVSSRAMQRRERRQERKKGRRTVEQRRQRNASGLMCQKREQNIGDALRANRSCRTDDDCRLLVRGCSPYITCGMPVNKGGLGAVKAAIGEYAKECPETTALCAACAPRNVICDRGFCRLDPPLICTQEARICPDGSSVSRNAHYDCQFDPCPAPSPASSEGEGTSTESQQPTP